MPLKIMLDDDVAVASLFARVVREVVDESGSRESLQAPDDLGHLAGLNLWTTKLREYVRGQDHSFSFILMTCAGSLSLAEEAIRLGDDDLFEKQISRVDWLQRVHIALDLRRVRRQCVGDDLEAHASRRWAELVVATIDSPYDPRTLRAWARAASTTVGALRTRCRIASIAAKASLDFARLLRAVVRRGRNGGRFEDLLDVIDERTLFKLLQRGGLGRIQEDTRVEAMEFLQGQTLVTDRVALKEVAGLVSRREQ